MHLLHGFSRFPCNNYTLAALVKLGALVKLATLGPSPRRAAPRQWPARRYESIGGRGYRDRDDVSTCDVPGDPRGRDPCGVLVAVEGQPDARICWISASRAAAVVAPSAASTGSASSSARHRRLAVGRAVQREPLAHRGYRTQRVRGLHLVDEPHLLPRSTDRSTVSPVAAATSSMTGRTRVGVARCPRWSGPESGPRAGSGPLRRRRETHVDECNQEPRAVDLARPRFAPTSTRRSRPGAVEISSRADAAPRRNTCKPSSRLPLPSIRSFSSGAVTPSLY